MFRHVLNMDVVFPMLLEEVERILLIVSKNISLDLDLTYMASIGLCGQEGRMRGSGRQEEGVEGGREGERKKRRTKSII
jgi:hypothetical protein